MKSRIKFRAIFLSGVFLAGNVTGSLSQGLSSAVNPGIITRLHVGDKVPSTIEIKNLINAKSSTVSLASFKGKLLLLDFWETTCASCIKAIPKIEALKKKYLDQIEVITVTRYSSKEDIMRIRQRIPAMKNFNLPTAIGDDQLFRYFPYKLISHVVWIGGDGVVKAITGTEHITEDNIREALEGKALNWPVKNDILDFDYTKPLLSFSNESIIPPATVYGSVFTSVIEGIDGTTSLHKDTLQNTVTINYFNTPLFSFCEGAVNGEITGALNLKDVILEVKEPSRYKQEKNTNGYNWTGKGTSNDLYSYSAVLPGDLSLDARRAFIREDISKWLKLTHNITITKEERTIHCLKLTLLNKKDKLATSKGEQELIELSGSKKIFRNAPLVNVLLYLNSEELQFPLIINETGLPANRAVDMELAITASSSVEELRQALAIYGLGLIESSIRKSMYIITEK